MTTFWDTFYDQPLDQIPWHKTQADYFLRVVESGIVVGDSVLDVGCGVGAKSIFLAQHGFTDIVGVDIAARAVDYAKQNAQKAGVSDHCSFHIHDVTDLSFLPPEKQFDLVVDWAVLHCIPEDKRKEYVEGVVKRVKQGGHLLLRVFSSETGEGSFTEEVSGQSDVVYVFSESEIVDLFKPLVVVEKNTSKPRTKPELGFLEVLFTREM